MIAADTANMGQQYASMTAARMSGLALTPEEVRTGQILGSVPGPILAERRWCCDC